MASIQQVGDRFRVTIRRKGQDLYHTFRNEKTALLWASYKEDLIDEMHAFAVPVHHMITLNEAIHLKYNDLVEKKAKELNDVMALGKDFPDFLERYLHEITLKEYSDHCDMMLNSTVARGGNHKTNGDIRKTSPQTVLRKFVVLASVYSLLITKGFDIENNPQKIVSTMRQSLKEND